MINYTVTTILIIIIITGTKSHSVMNHKRIRSYCSKPSNDQWILNTATSYLKLFVVDMGPSLVFKVKVNPQLPLANLGKVV